jgi:CheY-like chemotaxis protein
LTSHRDLIGRDDGAGAQAASAAGASADAAGPGFIEQVRDGLLSLYDLAALQAHPLAALAGGDETSPAAAGRRLRQALLDAIEALHPDPAMAETARTRRIYRILELRYIDACDVTEVMTRVALSRAQYHREHQRALQMVAAILQERWRGDRAVASDDAIWREADELLHDEHAGAIDLAEVARGVVPLVRTLCAGRPVEIVVELADDLPAVIGERVVLRQLLVSLLSHAVTAADRGQVELRLAPGEHGVVVTVGAPAATERAEAELGVRESRRMAAALGASLVYRPASTLHGRWHVRIDLPTRRPPRLLVVDNNADFARLVQRYLTDDDWEVIGAVTAEEAVRRARQDRPAALLMDVMLPGRDGWDLLSELKADPLTADIPAIVCSVLREPRMAAALGAVAYLQKPITRPRLQAALRSFKAKSPARSAERPLPTG